MSLSTLEQPAEGSGQPLASLKAHAEAESLRPSGCLGFRALGLGFRVRV